MFVGDWHRRNLLKGDKGAFPSEEKNVRTIPAPSGDPDWAGEISGRASSSQSEESFDIMHGVEVEKSVFLGTSRQHSEDEEKEF